MNRVTAQQVQEAIADAPDTTHSIDIWDDGIISYRCVHIPEHLRRVGAVGRTLAVELDKYEDGWYIWQIAHPRWVSVNDQFALYTRDDLEGELREARKTIEHLENSGWRD